MKTVEISTEMYPERNLDLDKFYVVTEHRKENIPT